MAIVLQPVNDARDFERAMAVRIEVFVGEQRVPVEIERDELDPLAWHLMALEGSEVVGTGRLVETETPAGERGRWGRVGRMAIRAAYRGRGVGAMLLAALEERARAMGLGAILLHAQIRAEGFYAKAGYVRHGAVFEEAGIEHQEMRKRLA